MRDAMHLFITDVPCSTCGRTTTHIQVEGGVRVCSRNHVVSDNAPDDVELLKSRLAEAEADNSSLRERVKSLRDEVDTLQGKLAVATSREGATKPDMPAPRRRTTGNGQRTRGVRGPK